MTTKEEKNVFDKVLFTSGPPSESQSEISSIDNEWSDIRTIALKLGVSNPDDLQMERFKIDRQKLENMIKSESPVVGMNCAEHFFDNIMKNTTTHISWPCRLKIGAKNKKDPHVRIIGKPEDVSQAKDQILARLDSRGTKVVMKMDVSYTDHSYIIGRCGNNIKRIMEETATHIHFPDSNRSNPVEKSNQVSLCGSLEGVERARSLVRSLTPLLFSFELPIMASDKQRPDHDTPFVKEIESKYDVQVIFSSKSKLHSSLVLVKGVEKESQKVQEATQLLINYTCEHLANQISVHMQLEISPQHHDIVKGKDNMNLLNIMEKTKTKIIFPDLNDINVKQIKKSQVTITGTIEGVYKARQQLIGNLPVVLIFDYPNMQTDTSSITSLGNKFGAFISIRQKQRQSTMAVIIKGIEKFVDKIYEAQHEILNLNTPVIKANIPLTYFSSIETETEPSYRHQLATLLSTNSGSPNTNFSLTPTSNATYNSCKSTSASLMIINTNFQVHQQRQLIKQQQQQQPQTQKQLHYNSSSASAAVDSCLSESVTAKLIQQKCQQQYPQQPQQLQQNNFPSVQQLGNILMNNSIASNYSNNSSSSGASNFKHNQDITNNSQTNNISNYLSMQHSQNLSPKSISTNTSGYQSFSSSTNSLEQFGHPYGYNNNSNSSNNGTINPSSNGYYYNPSSPASSALSSRCSSSLKGANFQSDPNLIYDVAGGTAIRNPNNSRGTNDGNLQNLLYSENANNFGPNYNEMNNNGFRTPTFDKNQQAFDFNMKRYMGYKAMEKQPQGESRTPNSNWMGLGLSTTSPVPLQMHEDLDTTGGWNVSNNDTRNYGYNFNATTSLVDTVPPNRRYQLAQHKDIQSLLMALGLERYIKSFVTNEIDLDIFLTLNEDNLIELGVTSLGARKKLLVAMHVLAAEAAMLNGFPSLKFSGSAAPGAERQISNRW